MRMSASVRLAACLLAVSVAGVPLPGWADTAPAPPLKVKLVEEKAVSNQPGSNTMSLDKAIAAAREKVPVPAELDMFSSDYQDYEGRQRWMLRWYSNKQPESSMHVTINAVTGEVENLSFYRGIKPGARYSGLPAYSRDQCLEIARKEGMRLFPDRFSGTVLAPREDWRPPLIFGERDYPVIYDFSFRRTAGGIPVVDQGIHMGVNAETGELIRFDCNWDTETVLPSPEGKISPDQAKKIFLEQSGYELTYYMTNMTEPDTPGELKLVYRPKPPGRFVLNALTGEVIKPGEMEFFFDDMGVGGMGKGMLYDRKQEAKPIPLTPAESRAVKETSELISADKALEIARNQVEIPKDYTLTGKNLERNYMVPGGRVWIISFTDSEKQKWFRVSVDARNGELLSFSREEGFSPLDYSKDPEVKVSEEEAKKIAWNLITRLQPAKSGQVQFRQADREIGPWSKMGSPVPRAYSFSYGRIINGASYPENGFRVSVNSTTGEVTYYSINWWDTSFPPAAGVIGDAAANAKFLADHPLTLEYSRGHKPYGGNVPPAYYLIYRPSGGYGTMIDAVTGQEIDYQGNPVVKKGKQPFTDIVGHPAEEDIKLLAAEGILSGEGGKFRPDDPATVAEVLAMMVKAYSHRGPYYPLMENKNDPWYKQVVESARAKGILDKDFSPDPESGLSRMQLARLGMNAGGWGKLAAISQIFRLEAADAGSIPPEYRGYVAAALGMELMAAEGGKFNPDGSVTRAEAARFLVKLLKK